MIPKSQPLTFVILSGNPTLVELESNGSRRFMYDFGSSFKSKGKNIYVILDPTEGSWLSAKRTQSSIGNPGRLTTPVDLDS